MNACQHVRQAHRRVNDTSIEPMASSTPRGRRARLREGSAPEADALRAGYPSLDNLLNELNRRHEGAIYRIEFTGIAPDPRVGLRESLPDETELNTILEQLNQLDARSTVGPWTATILELLATNR